MVDEGTVDPGTVATTPPGPGLSASPSIIGADGKFTDGWRDALPENVRGEHIFDNMDNFGAMATTLVANHRMVGKNRIAVPTETSTESDWQAFYDAGGRPKTAEDYGISKPEELPDEYWSPEFAKAAQSLFHKAGLSKRQADAIVAFNNANVMQALKNDQTRQQDELEQATHALQLEWGQAFEQKKHLGNLAIEQGCGGDEEFRDKIVNDYGNDPWFIKLMANLGGKFAEHGTVSLGKMALTPSDIQEQINELMHSDAYSNPNNPDHKNMVQKVQRLYLQKTGEKPML